MLSSQWMDDHIVGRLHDWWDDKTAQFAGRGRSLGVDELMPTLADVPEMEPVILLAHEPDIMPRVPVPVALVLSGHTMVDSSGCLVGPPWCRLVVATARLTDTCASSTI